MYKSSSNTRFINNMDNVPKFDFLLATSKSMRKKELKVKEAYSAVDKDENEESVTKQLRKFLYLLL